MLRPTALIFVLVDEVLHFARHEAGVVEFERFDHFLDQPQLIFAVENLKTLRQPGLAPMQTQQAMRQPVKSTQPEGTARISQQHFDAGAHFSGGLVGESDSENAVRCDPFGLNQPGNAMDQHPSLAAAGAGQHQRCA